MTGWCNWQSSDSEFQTDHRFEPPLEHRRRFTDSVSQSFSESKCCSFGDCLDQLSVCPTGPVCIGMITVRYSLQIMQSMSDFGGLHSRKHCTQEKRKQNCHWLLAFPGESSPNFPCRLEQEKLSNLICRSTCDIRMLATKPVAYIDKENYG